MYYRTLSFSTAQAIIEARWSPDKDTVALGSEDTDLYLYSTGGNYDLIATAGKHKHPVKGLPEEQTTRSRPPTDHLRIPCVVNFG